MSTNSGIIIFETVYLIIYIMINQLCCICCLLLRVGINIFGVSVIHKALVIAMVIYGGFVDQNELLQTG